MKESKFLGALLPSHSDCTPIIQVAREKYNLPKISTDNDLIKDIYPGDEFISLEEFLLSQNPHEQTPFSLPAFQADASAKNISHSVMQTAGDTDAQDDTPEPI